MTDLKIQLERLKRHYHNSVNSYDLISLIDLANALRIWTEFKADTLLNNDVEFKRWKLTKKLKGFLKNSEYICSSFPSGVTTFASNDVSKEIIFCDVPKSFTASVVFKSEKNTQLTLSRLLIFSNSLPRDEIDNMEKQFMRIPEEPVTFEKFMEAPAIFFNLSDHTPKVITNELLIKRIANEHGASHSKLSDEKFESNNIFSEIVRKLMSCRCAKLPLPYFALLYISKSIILNLEKKV